MAIKTKAAQNNNKQIAKAQVLETLRDLGNDAASSVIKDVGTEVPREFLRQLFGLPEHKVSGNIAPGESLSMEEVLSGQLEEKKRLQAQLAHERRMHAEEQHLTTKKQQELKIQLSVLTSEVVQLAQTTQGLSKEIKVAAMSAPVEPGVYHVIFFEKLIEFIKSFRKKIENASEWLATYNSRSRKRAHTFWAQVGVSGAKRLLSAEDSVQRAAA